MRAREPWEILMKAPSVTDGPCACTNPERGLYFGRDKRVHCDQCDGLAPDRTSTDGS